MRTLLKSVLDSWVRYEQQAKESEQAAFVKSVIESVLKMTQENLTKYQSALIDNNTLQWSHTGSVGFGMVQNGRSARGNLSTTK